MNQFDSMKGILGDTRTQHIKCAFADFLDLSRRIRDKLGRQSYLFDQYLSMLFKATKVKYTQVVADLGYQGESPMLLMCMEIVRNKPKTTENPLYDRMKSYIDGNPLPYQEDGIKRDVYYAMLSGEFLEQAVKLFEEDLAGWFRDAVDIIDLRDLYRKVCAALGSEDEMEKLHLLFRQRFIIATPVAIFMQGATSNLIDALLCRDPETSKQVFQLILDDKLRTSDGLQD